MMNYSIYTSDLTAVHNLKTYEIVHPESKSRLMIDISNDHPSVAFIYNLYVSEDQRGQGLGKDILNYALNFCREKLGCHTITLEVLKDNWVRDWYKRLGFRDVYSTVCSGYMIMSKFY